MSFIWPDDLKLGATKSTGPYDWMARIQRHQARPAFARFGDAEKPFANLNAGSNLWSGIGPSASASHGRS